jgi:hypothetical protein
LKIMPYMRKVCATLLNRVDGHSSPIESPALVDTIQVSHSGNL